MKLYHYTSGAGLYGIIESMELHCSHIDFLNDPTESTYFDSILENVISKNHICKKIHNELFSKNYYDFIYYNSTNYILSFCQNEDLLSMWNHYAKGNGYCIGFEIDIEQLRKFANSNDYGIDSTEIIYDSKDNLEKKITQFILPFNEEIIKAKNIESSNNDADIYPEIWRLQEIYVNKIMELKRKYKHPAYIYEKEFRLKISLPDYNRNNKDLTNYNVSKGGIFIEYFKLPIDGNIIQIKSVKCHPLATEVQQKGLERYLYNRLGYNKIDISKSNIPFREL